MNATLSPASSSPAAAADWERGAVLLGRSILFLISIYVPTIFFTWTWQHYQVPKVASFQFLVMVLLACWGVLAARRRCVRSPLATPTAAFFLVVMVTALGAVNLAEAWETVAFLCAGMVLIVLAPKFLNRYQDFEFLAYLYGFQCLMVDLYALAQWFGWKSVFEYGSAFGFRDLNTPKPVSFMGNENYAAEFLNLTIPICIAMIIHYRRRPVPFIFFSFVTLLNGVTMLYIDCNASYLGFSVSIPVTLILWIYYKGIPWSLSQGIFRVSRATLERWFRHSLVLGILAFCVGATVICSVPNPVRTQLVSMGTWVDVDGDLVPDGVAPIVFRLQCMDAAIRNIFESPFTGIGAGNFKVMHPLYESQLERKVLGEETLARKVHNDHLWHAVEFGVFGQFSWYWIITATFFGIFASLRILAHQKLLTARTQALGGSTRMGIFTPNQREFYFYFQLGIAGGLLTALVSCAFGHTFVIASGTVTYWMLTGVSMAVFQKIQFAVRGIPLSPLGTTEEPLIRPQQWTRRAPSYAVAAVLLGSVIPFGVLNTYQLIGETWLRHGMSERDNENYYTMFRCFQEAERMYPYQMEIFYILGRYYIDGVMATEGAILGGEQALEKIPEGLRPEYLQIYDERGIVTLQTDIFMNPNYKWAHNNLGVLYDRYYELIRPDSPFRKYFTIPDRPDQVAALEEASRQTYRRVLRIDKEQVYAHYNLGLGAFKRQDYKQAVDRLNMALMVDPTRYEIYRYLAQCFINMDDYPRAYRAVDKYLEKTLFQRITSEAKTSEEQKKYSLILQCLERGNYLQAVRLARQQLNWQSDELNTLYLKIASELAKDKNQHDLALEALEKAVWMLSSPPGQNLLFYAKLYESLGNLDKAVESMADYVRQHPSEIEYTRMLRNLYVQLGDIGKAAKTSAELVSRVTDNWRDLITHARILIGNRIPWEDVFPYVQQAVRIGGDEARKSVTEDHPGNFIQAFIGADPRLQQLLGPAFVKPSSPPESPAGEAVSPAAPDTIPDGTPAGGPGNTPPNASSDTPAPAPESAPEATAGAGGAP
ncbi:MAG: hypothetical protein ACE15F_18225 [bacterium]